MKWLQKLLGIGSDTNGSDPVLVDPSYAHEQCAVTFDSITAHANSPERLHEVAYRVSVELTDEGNLECAVAALQCATRIHFQHGNTLFNLALYYRMAGEFDAALQLYQLLMAIDPGSRSVMSPLIAKCKRRDSSGDTKYASARRPFVQKWLKEVGEDSAQPTNAARQRFRELMDDPATLTAELYDIGMNVGFLNHNDRRPEAFNSQGRHVRARSIGEILNTSGGFQLMQTVGNALSQPLQKSPQHLGGDLGCLTACWHEIGEWRK